MAVTKIYKVGAILFFEVTGDTKLKMMQYPNPEETVDDTTVRVTNLLNPKDPFNPSIDTPIADVRDSAGAAIGTQTTKEVLEYIAEQIAA